MSLQVAVDGEYLAYESAGNGPPACLTHQYGEVMASGALPEAFTPYFTLYAINGRDIAGSAPARSPGDLTMAGLADDLEAARRSLGLAPWVVIGHSTGGMVALLFALCHPESLRGLVLIGTAASNRFVRGSLYDPEHPRAAEMVAANKLFTQGQGGLDEWRRIVWRLSVADPEKTPPPANQRPPQMSWQRMQGFLQSLPGYDVEADLTRISVPTLVLVGRHDPQCPVQNSETLARGIRNAQLVVFEHSGHFPFLEEAATFRQVVTEWTQSLGLGE